MDNNEQTKLLRSIRNWLAYLSLLITAIVVWPILQSIMANLFGTGNIEDWGKLLLLVAIIGGALVFAHVADKSKEGQ